MIAIFPPRLSETMNSNVKLFGLSYVRIARPLGLHIQKICSTYVYWIRQLVAVKYLVQVRDTSQTVTQNSRNGPGWKRLNTLAMAVCLCLNFWLDLACTAQLQPKLERRGLGTSSRQQGRRQGCSALSFRPLLMFTKHKTEKSM